MSLQSISKSEFYLTPLNENAYQLDIHFLDEKANLMSKKNIVFIQQKQLEPGETLDIYSQNGVCSDPILNLFKSDQASLFSKHNECEIKKAAKKMDSTESMGPSVIVLDMKDLAMSYLDKTVIAEAEKTVCSFFKEKSLDESFLPRVKRVHTLFLDTLSFDFIISEGSLKCDLLRNFSDMEADYFLKPGIGGISFCQCAEFFMNGFKLGQAPKGVSAENYFQAVSSRFPIFNPQSKSTVWYPAAYKKIYSLEGNFAQGLKPVFSVSGGYDPVSTITTMSVGIKNEILPG